MSLRTLAGLYSEHLPKWMELFELEKELHVIDGENLKKHPWEEIAAVHRFLGLPVSMTKKVSASKATMTMMLA